MKDKPFFPLPWKIKGENFKKDTAKEQGHTVLHAHNIFGGLFYLILLNYTPNSKSNFVLFSRQVSTLTSAVATVVPAL